MYKAYLHSSERSAYAESSCKTQSLCFHQGFGTADAEGIWSSMKQCKCSDTSSILNCKSIKSFVLSTLRGILVQTMRPDNKSLCKFQHRQQEQIFTSHKAIKLTVPNPAFSTNGPLTRINNYKIKEIFPDFSFLQSRMPVTISRVTFQQFLHDI